MSESLTNKVWETDGLVAKYLSKGPWSSYLMYMFEVFTLHFDFQSREDRMANEVRAKQLLAAIDVNVPRVVGRKGNFLAFERVPGVPLSEYVVEPGVRPCFRAGVRKGLELEELHRNGMAYIDCRCSNTLVGEHTLWSIDHELFREDADRLLQEVDLMTLTATAKLFPMEKYTAFVDGLEEGYGRMYRVMNGFRSLVSGVAAVGYAVLVERNPRSVLNVLKNWLYDLRPFWMKG